MASTFGEVFRITTFGESHGAAIGVVIDGLPAGLSIDEESIAHDLKKRTAPCSSTRSRQEADEFEILSGVFEGKSTGHPLAILIRNVDARSEDYASLRDVYRPGHADQTWHEKYGIYDYRGAGRASGLARAKRIFK